VEKIETALEPNFQQYFIAAMALPHKTDSYAELSKVVTLPAPKPAIEGSAAEERKRRSRRRRSRAD
jgi:uncharacterized 2Fe-2S/4Fe-4S cluster protein (DUF4445 family)